MNLSAPNAALCLVELEPEFLQGARGTCPYIVALLQRVRCVLRSHGVFGSAGRLRSCDLRVMGPADFQTFPQRKLNRTERNRTCQPPDGVLIPQNSQEAHKGFASCRRPAKCARSILARSGPFQSSSSVLSFKFPKSPAPEISRRLQL